MVHETEQRDQECKAEGLNESLYQQHEAREDLYLIVDDGGVDSVLRHAFKFALQPPQCDGLGHSNQSKVLAARPRDTQPAQELQAAQAENQLVAWCGIP